MLSTGKLYQFFIILLLCVFPVVLSAQDGNTKEKYNTALNQAEKLYFEKKYAAAKEAFKAALKIKPDENHPVTRINEINKILGIDEEVKGQFAQLVDQADGLYKQEKFEEALEVYNKANRINPEDTHVADRILELHTTIRREKNLNGEYNDLISKGDLYLENNDLEKARQAYSDALSLKSGEDYPANRIKEIDNRLKIVENYNAAVEAADALYIDKKYDQALEAYTEAGKIKPDEDYPKSMIGRIEDLFAELEEKYQAAVEQGDNYFDAEKLDQALESYQKAQGLKPEESYPKSMITMINGMIEGAAEADAKYNQQVAKGDELLKEKNYVEAQMAFEKAAEIKPDESYPKEKLDEIAGELAKIAALEEEFQTIISRADDYFSGAEYDKATAEYQKALEVKPKDTYATSQIEHIEKLKAEIAATQKAYDEAIANADQAFETKDYESAKAEYEKASSLKPEEEYPKNKLAEISTILNGIAETNAAYDEAIANADQAFETKDYESAKADYEKATSLKPEEEYPKNKLTEISTLLNGIAETNAAYDEAIANADQAFETEDYESAKADYEKATSLKPEEEYPKNKLTEISTILNDIAETNAAYDEAIANADQAFETEDYASAKANYEKATSLKPEEEYPKNKLTEISTLLNGIAETNAAYDEAIANADQAFNSEDYASAKANYEKASSLKPEEEYPKNKLAEISTILNGIAETNASYDQAITNADQFFETKDYESAKAEYEKASSLKPEEEYPKNKLTEISILLNGIAETNAAYDEAIANADQAFETKDYESAKAEYEKASSLKPEEEYPKNKLAEISTILTGIAETNAAYDEAIANADQAFNSEDYASAKANYEKASSLKPEEDYPKNKLAEISTILTGIAETNATYDEAIANADQAFETEDYESAKANYEKASSLKPEEEYPKNKLTEISTLLNGIAETNAAYDEAIANADQAFETEDYASAKANFEKASSLKPEEEYPKNKLAEISTILNGIAETNAAYDEAIANADQAFETEDYESAKAEYEKASSLKPEEDYPKNKLAEISTILNGIAETNAAYNEAIANADQAFETKDYESAKAEYEKASSLKPEEEYPKNKLTEISTILNGIAETNAAYDEAIANADQAFNSEDYASAKANYEKASSLKPEEEYPKNKLAEISTLLNGIAETNAAYDEAIANADQAFETEDYESAKANYEKATSLKPEEEYPKNKLAEISTILNGIAETSAAYDEAIANADQAFNSEDYQSAKANYEKAGSLKPEEEYPKNKLAEISTILNGIAETNANYNEAIANADQAFETEDYASAKANYEKASSLKPEEEYPKNKLAEISTILTGIAETNANYDEAIANADQAFETEDYESAKANYEKASSLKPEEEYPKNKLTEISTILNGIAETNAAYDEAIANADQAFETEDYQSAKANYEKASSLKPEEEYPKNKLTEISTILTGIAETNAAYDQAIATADQAFNSEDYASAKAEYEKATSLKPDEDYPKNKLTEISTILTGIAETNAAYDEAIANADQAFNSEEYESAKANYEKAGSLKPEEEYPKTRLEATNAKLTAIAEELARKRKEYDDLVSSGDFQLDADNYQKAKSSYKEALALFPDEEYPKQKIREVDDILAAEYEKARQEYNKLVKEADRYFDQKVYDNAIQYYMSASKVLPEETYPEDRIKAIRKIIEENVVVTVVKSREQIGNNELKQFDFEPVPRVGRKESYVVVKAKNLSDKDFRLFLNYGKDGQKNGGFVINIPEQSSERDYIVKVGGQYKWFSEDNNWISLQPEGGEVEISFIQISQE